MLELARAYVVADRRPPVTLAFAFVSDEEVAGDAGLEAVLESVLVTIDVDASSDTVDRLRDDGIVVRALPSPNAIRVSVHAVNTAAEIDAFLDALADDW